MSAAPGYVFGPRDRRGFILGLRLGQVAIASVGAVTALGLMMAASASPIALAAVVLVVTVTAAATIVPIGGRGVDEWAVVAAGFLLAGECDWRSPLPHLGRVLALTPRGAVRLIAEQPALPPTLRDCSLIAIPVPRGLLGVVSDRRRGTYTAVVRVRGSSFTLLDEADKARRMGAWGSALATLAHLGTPVQAIQLVIRNLAEDPDALGRYLVERRVVDVRSPILRSYLSLVDDAVPVTHAQEVYLALQVGVTRARRAIRQAGGGDAGAGAVLARQLHALQGQLERADIGVDGALPPRLLARVMREAWDPTGARNLRLAARNHPGEEGVDPAGAGPLSVTRRWRAYATDSGSLSVSWWISEWPRSPVGADYLVPLLLQTQGRMTFSVTLKPVDPLRARRELEAAQTEHISDEELRSRHGFRTSIDQRRQVDAVERREAELADGHAEFRFCGHITVSADSPEQLNTACAEVEQQARSSCLDIRRMDGEHDLGFSYTLPLARGLW